MIAKLHLRPLSPHLHQHFVYYTPSPPPPLTPLLPCTIPHTCTSFLCESYIMVIWASRAPSYTCLLMLRVGRWSVAKRDVQFSVIKCDDM